MCGQTEPNTPPNPPTQPTQASHSSPTVPAWQYVSALHPSCLLTGQYWEGAQEKEWKTNMQPGLMHPPRGRCCVPQGLTVRRTSRPFQTCYPVLVSRDFGAQPERRKSMHASAKAPNPHDFAHQQGQYPPHVLRTSAKPPLVAFE